MRMSEKPTRLWAPWRTEYLCRPQPRGCFLCRAARARDDERNLVVGRYRLAIVALNRFPYNSGHLLIAPRRHVGDVGRLTRAESRELFALVQQAVRVLRRRFRPDGFNVGLNLGRVAGAGLPGHVHVHVVPRWNGDTNFMPAISATRVISEHLEQTWRKLSGAF
jgi:ATP adenylyltransferase